MQYYEILGLSPNAEPQVIDAAYKAMMRRYHPDVFQGSRDEAERRSKALNEAYQVLRDPAKRAEYDRLNDLGATDSPSPPEQQEGPEPWDWESDPLSLRRVPENPFRAHRWKLAGAGLVAIAVWATFQNFSATEVLASSSPPEDLSQSELPTPFPSTQANGEAGTVPPSLADCRGADCRVLTPFGWGGVEAGVTVDSAVHSSGMRLGDNGHYTEAGDGYCLAYEVIGGPENIQMLVEGGRISTVEVWQMKGQPTFQTDRGVKLGDSERAVRAAYKDLKQLPSIYTEPPDKMLFHYEPGGERGIKFAIIEGVVAGISVGTDSIEYVEGCL